jgi:phosphatidate phosphatase APP1
LISDIDDTILVTQVLDKSKLLKNSLTIPPESRQAVAGMAQLYRKLMDDLPHPAAAPVCYVSASPKQLSDYVRRFLARHQFPRGVLQLREISPQAQTRDPLADTQAYKIQRIQAILDGFPGVRFVLVGDDAERDPEIYAHFQQVHPERLHSVWIRRVHPDPNRPRYPQQRDLNELLSGALPW